MVHWFTCRCWAYIQLSQGSCDRISDCVLSLVFFRWAAPMEVNGLLEFYTLYQSALGEELAVIYNSSELFEDYTVRNLIPGSTYLFQIAVRWLLTCFTTHTHKWPKKMAQHAEYHVIVTFMSFCPLNLLECKLMWLFFKVIEYCANWNLKPSLLTDSDLTTHRTCLRFLF